MVFGELMSEMAKLADQPERLELSPNFLSRAERERDEAGGGFSSSKRPGTILGLPFRIVPGLPADVVVICTKGEHHIITL